MKIEKMTINDYEKIYSLWLSCKGMGLNKVGFEARNDLIYRNKTINEFTRIDT